MSYTATQQFTTSKRVGIYDPLQHISMWREAATTFKSDAVSTMPDVVVNRENKPEYPSHDSLLHSTNDQEATKPPEKVQRRLAQNREAARKSRMRKKAYVQQLESSRLKLAQMEQELERARHQGLFIRGALEFSNVGLTAPVNPGVIAFDLEYGHWVEEQQRQGSELRNALQVPTSEVELRILVNSALSHYHSLFRIKAEAAKADVFYLMSGTWRSSAERFFLWLGGSRPSELLNILMPQIEPLTEQQKSNLTKLQQSSRQAEDALSQGMEKLQQTLAKSVTDDPFGLGTYGYHIAIAVEKLEALEGFINQADHLRQQTLTQTCRFLTTHQAARGLIVLGEYFHRLRALSTLWATRPCE